jgi:hypothetical protein
MLTILHWQVKSDVQEREKSGEYDTAGSRVITDLSTNAACGCLTLQIGRDTVFSTKCGRTQLHAERCVRQLLVGGRAGERGGGVLDETTCGEDIAHQGRHCSFFSSIQHNRCDLFVPGRLKVSLTQTLVFNVPHLAVKQR